MQQGLHVHQGWLSSTVDPAECVIDGELSVSSVSLEINPDMEAQSGSVDRAYGHEHRPAKRVLAAATHQFACQTVPCSGILIRVNLKLELRRKQTLVQVDKKH